MSELDVPCTAAEVAVHYPGLIDGIIIDEQDSRAGGRNRSSWCPSHYVKYRNEVVTRKN